MPCPQFLALKWKSREVVQKDVPIVSEGVYEALGGGWQQ